MDDTPELTPELIDVPLGSQETSETIRIFNSSPHKMEKHSQIINYWNFFARRKLTGLFVFISIIVLFIFVGSITFESYISGKN